MNINDENFAQHTPTIYLLSPPLKYITIMCLSEDDMKVHDTTELG